MKRILFSAAGFLASASLFFCQSPDSASEHGFLNVAADSAYFDYSRLWVVLIDSSGRDTTVLFNDSLKTFAQLNHIRLERVPDGPVKLVILGFGKGDGVNPVYQENRIFNMTNDSLVSNTITLDERNGISQPPRIPMLTVDSAVKARDSLHARARVEDPDGRIVSLRWFFDEDTLADRTDSTNSTQVEATASWVYPSPQARQISLEAHDNTGNRVRKTLSLTILPEGRPGIGFAYRDTTISILDSLFFTAYVRDTNGTVDSYAWDLEGKGRFQPALVLEKASDTLRIGRRFPDSGSLIIALRIMDNYRKETRDSVHIRVLLDRPSADAGRDTTVTVGDTVRLHGQGRDGLGRIVRTEWSITGNPFIESDGSFGFAAPLDSGVWPCILRVTDDDGLMGFDTILVRTVYSDDAYLALLQPATGSLVPSFSRAREDYAISVPYGVATLTLKLRPENPRARLSVSGRPIPAGDSIAQAPLLVGTNVIAILVLAQDGKADKSYSLNVTRERNGDAALKSLAVSPGALSPAFAPDSLFYRVTLRDDQPSLVLVPAARDEANARIKVQGAVVNSGNATGSFPIAVGTDTLRVDMTAQDEAVSRVYRVAVTRLPSGDATLKALNLSSGALTPGFQDTVHTYAMGIPNSITGLALRPTPGSLVSRVWVAGKIVAAGAWSDTLPLMVGDNSIAIRLVAENGDSGNYSVQVHRRNANADLVALTVNRGTLVPAFRPSDTAYTDTLLADSLTVNATADPSARLVQVVLDSPRVAGTPPMTFAMREGGQRVNVLVTAEEGNTRSYSIRVHRISRDTNLAGLAVSPGGLAPVFQTGTKAYSVTVANAESLLAFKAIPSHARAKVWLGATPVSADSFSARRALPVGNSVFRLRVVAESGDSGIYTVTIRRKSANADLKSLQASSGTLVPAFNSRIRGYVDTVTTASISLTAIAEDKHVQSIKIGATGFSADSATGTIALNPGLNTIEIRVRSEDGNEEAYTVGIHRIEQCTPPIDSGSWSEDFAGVSLGAGWSVFQYTGQRHNSQTSPANRFDMANGRLRYILEPMTRTAYSQNYEPWFDGTWYWYDPALEFSHELGGTKWTLEAKVSWHVPNVVNAAGLGISVHFGPDGPSQGFDVGFQRYSNDDVGAGTDPNHNFFNAWVGNVDWTQWATLEIDITRWIRIQRNGETATVSWSTDSTTWNTVAAGVIPAQLPCSPQRLHISGNSWFSPAGSYADYQYVKFTRGNVP